MKAKTKKIALATLSVTMAATLAASQLIAYATENRVSPAPAEKIVNGTFNNLTGSIDLSDIARNNFSEQVMDFGEEVETQNVTGSRNTNETLIISLDFPSLMDSKSDDQTVAEFLSTTAGKIALDKIAASQSKLLSQLSSAGISYKEVSRYNTVLNAVAIEVNTAQFKKIKSFAGVGMVGVSKTYAALEMPDAQVNPSNVYGTGIYDSSKIMSEYGYDGSGVTVAILDTGLDYTHEAFSHDPETVSFDKSHIQDLLDENSLQAQALSPNATVEDFYLSAKVPFAYDYADKDTDVYPSYSQHGVHVAGIVAGEADTYIDKDGHQVGTVGDGVMDFMGAAPKAQLVICKVFTDDLESDDLGGATSEDIIAALDDCATLGVDIINMSLGTASGFSSIEINGDEEGMQLKTVYEKIKKAGISLIAAAGNEFSAGFGSEFGTNLASNPDAGTVGSPSTFVGAMSVASINGQQSPFMLANPGENSKYGSAPIYYNESNNANSVPYEFAEDLLGNQQSGTFTYLVITGNGGGGDYTSSIRNRLKPESEGGLKKAGEKILVVVRRGTIDFKEKVETAKNAGADGIIVYNNVPGTIRMSLGDIEEKNYIPAISINMDAGNILTIDPNNPNRLRSEGKIEVNKTYLAGPFMNDYSSWGATPDLKLKPDITSHGGEITSAVSGGYEEMSGTSMATPNLAGLMALVKDYLKSTRENLSPAELTTITNQIVMSSAKLVYDEEKLPYSPRKQGAGLATLSNIFTTKAYLSTDEKNGGSEDNRPKIELGDDKSKNGVYEFTFEVNNFGDSELKFELVPRFMTETIASDGLAVAEAAHMLTDIPAQFTVNGADYSNGVITLSKNGKATISVKLALSTAEKKYIDDNFKNGMYVEGFISLVSKSDGQCDLNLPFMGFYGDWKAAPMLDYNAYEIAAIEQDSSLDENEKPHESVFATQMYSTYYNGRYAVPMGGFAYVQDEDAQQIYVTEDHCSVSRFNVFNGATSMDNYLTSTGIRALYAGLLRNAELVTYDIYDANTGELIREGEKYRVGKAYAGGGSTIPALVDLKLDPDELGLVNNGKYTIEFNFYMKAEDKGQNTAANTFKTNFYADYDAPILEDTRLRFYDYTENNKAKQRVYLDLDIYDNHYPQSVLLCYSDEDYDPTSDEVPIINMATEYVTPIYNSVRNSTTTVSIEVTDIYEKYRNKLYIQVDDFSLNHSVYNLNFTTASQANQDEDMSFVINNRVTETQTGNNQYRYDLKLEVNELYTVGLNCGNSNPSNYAWETLYPDIVNLKYNQLFGVSPGKATVTVYDGNGKSLILNVEVVPSSRKLPTPNFSFGAMVNSNLGLQKPGSYGIEVNAGQTFKMTVESDPWYYPVNELEFSWSSSNPDIASVDQNGVVTTNNTRGSTVITATAQLKNLTSTRSAVVTLNVADPFVIANMTLNHYYGSEEEVLIPQDQNVMYIGEEAFEDNNTMKRVIIPQTVTEISERAFLNCTALEEVYFIEKTDDNSTPVLDLAAINLILADAFQGCENLRILDLTNVKVVTIGATAFADCKSLEKIRHMEKIGIAEDYAFRGCESLQEANITGLHTVGYNVFEGCTGLTKVVTAHYSSIGEGMFYGCTNLKEVTINNPRVSGSRRVGFGDFGFGGGAFENCTSLNTVTFGGDETREGTVFRIDPYAFAGCTDLTTVNFGNYNVSLIGDFAFMNTGITAFTMPGGDPVLGESVFGGKTVNITWPEGYEKTEEGVYKGTTLMRAPENITESFSIKPGTTEIAPYAFTDSKFADGVTTVMIPETVTIIGEGAFCGTPITSITIPAEVTEIPAYAFMGSRLESIEIPANITLIGYGAFANCESLSEITFAPETSLVETGDYAFSSTAISSIEMPDGVKTMGSYTFSGCENLTNVKLPSVTSLGEFTFAGCVKLSDASFGSAATASGTFTFSALSYIDMAGNRIYNESALKNVDLGGLESLGRDMFSGCKNLQSIELKNVKKLGAYSFAECDKLSSITGLDKLTEVGDFSFANDGMLRSANLAAAKYIGIQAFINVPLTSLTISQAETIGIQAFANINISELQIPATLTSFGDGAFMRNLNLNSVTIDPQNKNFFVKDNVLYRYITDSIYELCLYPANLHGTESGGIGNTVYNYKVLDGTASIQAYAFAHLRSGMINNITLPYSLKLIGISAFYKANIGTYNFECIDAPTLLSEYRTIMIGPNELRSLYYTNFNDDFAPYWTTTTPSTVRIGYPSNGVGYDNFIFRRYFGSTVDLGELQENETRELAAIIDGFDIEKVNGWVNADVNDAAIKEEINSFSEAVKNAHRLYNNIKSAKQLEYLNEGENRVEKLFAIEEALKPIKARFNIVVNVMDVSIDSSSTYRKDYKAGETFDITGLVLSVIYDDYSTETITDLSEVTLLSDYSGPLDTFYEYVEIVYGGRRLRVPITVTSDGSGSGGSAEETPPPAAGGNCSGCGSMDIGSTLGGTGLMLLAMAGILFTIEKIRRKAENKSRDN